MKVDNTSTSFNTHTNVSGSPSYTVMKGDTLTSIAKQAGVALKDLLQSNPQIKDPNKIFPGQEITIPPKSTTTPAPGTQVPQDTFQAADKTAQDFKTFTGATPPGAKAFNPPNVVLREGATGNNVKLLQNALKDHGFNPGPVDGQFGPKTEAAVKSFQRAHGLTQDGIVGPKTWNALANVDTKPPTTTHPTLKQGSQGAAVEQLQSRLKELGFNPGPIDGDFGARTKSAVMSFQRAAGITQDGVVGPQTWRALDAGNVEPPTYPHPGDTHKASDFVDVALAQNGDRYVYGAETDLNDPDPDTFDCSELVQWAAAQVGINFVDGSSNQLAACRRAGTNISVEEAIHTRGALLFKEGHVAISLGDGRTIEAMGSKYGVRIGNAYGRFTSGGLVPNMEY